MDPEGTSAKQYKAKIKSFSWRGSVKLRRRINDAREEIEVKFKAEKPRHLCETRFTNSFPLRLFADTLFCKYIGINFINLLLTT